MGSDDGTRVGVNVLLAACPGFVVGNKTGVVGTKGAVVGVSGMGTKTGPLQEGASVFWGKDGAKVVGAVVRNEVGFLEGAGTEPLVGA